MSEFVKTYLPTNSLPVYVATLTLFVEVPTLICFALKEAVAPFRKIAAGKSGISILLTGRIKKRGQPDLAFV